MIHLQTKYFICGLNFSLLRELEKTFQDNKDENRKFSQRISCMIEYVLSAYSQPIKVSIPIQKLIDNRYILV